MERRDNYAIQAQQARQLFLQYDQQDLIRKLGLAHDGEYLYVRFLCKPYRIHRATAQISRLENGQWVDGNSFNEVLTLFDLVCGSRENRSLSGNYRSLESFGLQFHQNLTGRPDPTAAFFDRNMDRFRRACQAMGGVPLPQGDAGYAIEVFDGLRVALILWSGDDEFPARLRFLWDENALLYLRYETMYYAIGQLLTFLKAEMETMI